MSENEKNELLGELSSVEEDKKNLDISHLLMSIMILFICVALLAPKIYLRNQIYYKSREITKLEVQYDSLIEENRYLRKQLEDLKFKNLMMELGN